MARTVNGLGDRLLNVQAKTAHALAKPETRLQDGYMAWTVYSNDRFRRCASHSCSAELLYYAEKFCNLGILPLSNVLLTSRLKALFDRFHSFLLASLQKAIPDFTAPTLPLLGLPFGDQTFSEYLHYSVQGLFFSPSEVSGLFRPLPPSLGFCYTHQFASTSSLRLPTRQTLYTRMHPPA